MVTALSGTGANSGLGWLSEDTGRGKLQIDFSVFISQLRPHAWLYFHADQGTKW